MKLLSLKPLKLITAAAVACAAIFGSCVRDDIEADSMRSPQDIDLNFDIEVPADTRALGVGEDELVGEVDVIAFVEDTGAPGTYYYNYKAKTNSFSKSGMNVTANVKVKAFAQNQIFVILANSSDELAASGITFADDIPTAMAKLRASSTNEWPAKINGAAAYDKIPMYAKLAPQIVAPTTTSLGTGIPLLRMLALIEVTLKAGINNFILEDARIYNRMQHGYIAYDFSGWNGTKATSAAILSQNHSGNPIVLPSVAYASNKLSDPRGEILRSIYTFESPGRLDTDREKATAIVIGGKYNGSATPTYYRCDIAPATTPAGYVSVDIVRNHKYKIEIQSFSGEGYANPDDAYRGKVQVNAVVTAWDSADRNVIFDGQYYLKIDKDAISLDYTGTQTATVVAEGNYDVTTQGFPAGIVVNEPETEYTPAVPQSGRWLTVTPAQVKVGDVYTNTLTFKATANMTGQKRIAKAYVRAGNMRIAITVTQGIECGEGGTPLAITIGSGTYLTHLYADRCWMVENSKEGTAAYTTYVGAPAPAGNTEHYYKWPTAHTACPAGWVLPEVVSLRSMSSYASPYATNPLAKWWGGPLADPSTVLTGSYASDTGFMGWSMQAAWWGNNSIEAEWLSGDTNTLYGTAQPNRYPKDDDIALTVRCARLETINSQGVLNPYKMDGTTTHSFTVKSKYAWTASVAAGDDPDGIMNLITTSGAANQAGQTFNFKLNDPGKGFASVTITFKPQNSGDFADYKVVIEGQNEFYPDPLIGWAGSNIYWDGSRLTFDDAATTTHEAYQGLFFKWGSLTGISPESANFVDGSTKIYVNSEFTTWTVDRWDVIPALTNHRTITTVGDKTKRNYLLEWQKPDKGVGDICAYLSGKAGTPSGNWRMPTAKEYQDLLAAGTAAEGTRADFTTGLNNGRFASPSGRRANTEGAFFPHTGWRDQAAGAWQTGQQAYYWSASPDDGNGVSYDMYFDINAVLQSNLRGQANPVRCVKDAGIAAYDVKNPYLMDGTTTHDFKVRSTVAWTAVVTSDPQGIVKQLITTSGGTNGTITSTTVQFTLEEKYVSNATATIRFSGGGHLHYVTIKGAPNLVVYTDNPEHSYYGFAHENGYNDIHGYKWFFYDAKDYCKNKMGGSWKMPDYIQLSLRLAYGDAFTGGRPMTYTHNSQALPAHWSFNNSNTLGVTISFVNATVSQYNTPNTMFGAVRCIHPIQ